MKNWKFGASAKEFERLKEYANQFELLEIYLEQGLKKIGFQDTEVNDILGNNWYNFYRGINT